MSKTIKQAIAVLIIAISAFMFFLQFSVLWAFTAGMAMIMGSILAFLLDKNIEDCETIGRLQVENYDLRDEISDLKVFESKARKQQVLIGKLQERLQRLNHLVNYGTESYSSTTLEDVHKLDGTIETPLPTFKEIEDQEDK